MYRLYYYPRNASWAPHLVLEEMDLEYELVLVDRKADAQKSRDYMEINPTGRIPTLIHNGTVVFESAAICLYLCESSPQFDLSPKAGDPLRAKFFQWLFYLNSTLQPELMVYFYPDRHTTVNGVSASISQAQEIRVTEMFQLIDAELQGREFLVGSSITVCDFFLFMLSHWASEFQTPPLSLHSLGRYLRQLALRPSIINVCAVEGTSLDAYHRL